MNNRRRLLFASDIRPTNYITFESDQILLLESLNGKTWDGKLYYESSEGWVEWDGSEIYVAGELHLCGEGNTTISGVPGGSYTNFVFSRLHMQPSYLDCSGNIESLLDWKDVRDGRHPAMAAACFSHLFNDCTYLTSGPELPATTLAVSCYASMFSGCTSLATLPALPATELKSLCYYSMFNGCTSIKLSTTYSTEYRTPYSIPMFSAGSGDVTAMLDMFKNTGGAFTGTPSINTTYYTSNRIV